MAGWTLHLRIRACREFRCGEMWRANGSSEWPCRILGGSRGGELSGWTTPTTDGWTLRRGGGGRPGEEVAGCGNLGVQVGLIGVKRCLSTGGGGGERAHW